MATASRRRKAETGGTALLIVDMINPLDFEGGKAMRPQAAEAARRIATLKQRLKREGVPVVYVNDNFIHELRGTVRYRFN